MINIDKELIELFYLEQIEENEPEKNLILEILIRACLDWIQVKTKLAIYLNKIERTYKRRAIKKPRKDKSFFKHWDNVYKDLPIFLFERKEYPSAYWIAERCFNDHWESILEKLRKRLLKMQSLEEFLLLAPIQKDQLQ